ncbi:MAG TPA: cobalamin-binding protein [Vicinamibacterales bacterium]|jgi:iron complex transport system substrate-binding protein|nr:cobalamin-binding protein [Vicinamibacterales bacterium]
MRRASAPAFAAAMCLVAAASGADAAVRGVTDGVGRHLEVPDTPRRIVTLTPSLAEIVYGIGAGDAIAGVTDHTDYPAEARAKPSVGGMVDPSVERIVALRPDLVLATLESNRQTTIDGLQRLGIPVFVIRPEGLDGILQAVEQIGLALNRLSDARTAVDRLRVRRQELASRVAGLTRPRVFVLIWPDPVVTVGHHAFITEAIEAAGAECVTSNLPQPWPRVSLEEVVRLAPDTIVLIANGHPTLSLDELARRPGWNRVPAAIAHRFVEIDARLEHSSPVVFDALEALARALHPEAFHKP